MRQNAAAGILYPEQHEPIPFIVGSADGDGSVLRVFIGVYHEVDKDLQKHFKANPKDHASRRGLLKLVGQRRRTLKYIKNRDINEYRQLIAELGLRK